MDLEILEALALSDDRASARATLLPGSEVVIGGATRPSAPWQLAQAAA